MLVLFLTVGTSGEVCAQAQLPAPGHTLEGGHSAIPLLPGILEVRRPSSAITQEQSATRFASKQSGPAQHDAAKPIEIEYGFASSSQAGDETVYLLRGPCTIRQGNRTWSAPKMVVWDLPAQGLSPRRLLAYLESTSEVQALARERSQRIHRPSFLIELTTTAGVRMTSSVTGRTPVALPAMMSDPVVVHGIQRRKDARLQLQQTQYVVAQGPALAVPPLPAPVPALRRRVTIGPRFLGESFEFKSAPFEGSVPEEFVITVSGGVNIVVDNVPLQVEGRTVLTRIDLSADRAVVWTNADPARERSFEIDENTPFQVYLEGNIIVRQGTSDVRATHAYYDVNQRRGLLMNAEVRTFIPDFEGTLRLRAAEVRMFSETNFHARNAWFSTSEFGRPKWRLEASDIFLEERPTGARDPRTGLPETAPWLTSVNNRLFAEEVPVMAFPRLTGPAADPHIPIRKLNVGYSGMFGLEIESVWNLEGVLGLQLPSGVDWELQADYFSERGPAIGTRTEYDFFGALLGVPAHHEGQGQVYYINDSGFDNLGLGRRRLAPANDNRGWAIWRNRSRISPNTWITGEIGHVFSNDRNFVEQFFEHDWDTDKDLENLASIHHQFDNLTGSLLVSGRSNDFANQTDWLPRADLTILGEPIGATPLLWSMHSSVGYGHSRPAQAPPDPIADPFAPLPYFQDLAGTVAMSRHEISLPFNIGPVNVSPYALGEVAYWDEDLTGDQLTRWYGSGGVRASVQFSKYLPQIRDPILGLNGLAHKVTYELDYYFADASEPFARIPQYNEFDDNAQERFRERFLPIEFGGVLPLMFNPRNYAVRSGTGRAVTAPFHELVDDQHVLRFGMHHRWQTKVGPPDRPRIVDWMELDLGASLYPDANQDNFGEDFGLINGRYAWHVGPRTSLLANGTLDLFDMGQQVWNVGLLTQRSTRGSLYLGYREIQAGPIDSQLVTGSFSYVMSPNLYVATFGASFDIAEGMDRGQSLTLTRIGEYFLLHFGFGYDRSRDNVGVALSLEPKFGAFGQGSMQLNSLLGIR